MRVPSAEHRTQLLDIERPDDLVEVGVYVDSNTGFDHGLVVLAMGEARFGSSRWAITIGFWWKRRRWSG